MYVFEKAFFSSVCVSITRSSRRIFKSHLTVVSLLGRFTPVPATVHTRLRLFSRRTPRSWWVYCSLVKHGKFFVKSVVSSSFLSPENVVPLFHYSDIFTLSLFGVCLGCTRVKRSLLSLTCRKSTPFSVNTESYRLSKVFSNPTSFQWSKRFNRHGREWTGETV